MSKIREVALESGIRKEALEDLDLIDSNLVTIEKTDQGRVNVHGVSDFVDSLKTTKPHWFGGSKPPTVNPGNPGAVPGGKVLTPGELAKLEMSDPAKYKVEMEKYLKQRNK